MCEVMCSVLDTSYLKRYLFYKNFIIKRFILAPFKQHSLVSCSVLDCGRPHGQIILSLWSFTVYVGFNIESLHL